MTTDTQMMADLKHLVSQAEGAVRAGQWTKVKQLAEQIILLEDAIIIYRLNRSPERQVFEVEVGGI